MCLTSASERSVGYVLICRSVGHRLTRSDDLSDSFYKMLGELDVEVDLLLASAEEGPVERNEDI
jgi:hypothetical protein